ncbi:hypothetical protein GCM10027519_24340 [Kineococcus endophyticus]
MDGWPEAVQDHLRELGVVVVEDLDDPTGPAWWVVLPTGSRHRYDVVLRERLSTATAATVPLLDGPSLVVTRHVADAAAEVLRGRGAHFADTAGNVHLRWPDAVVDVRGRRPPTSEARPADRPLRAYSPRGQRVTFSLLCDPGTVGESYRTIAERSRTSLGTVQAVLEELQGQGHLLVDGRRRTLHGTRLLFDRWVEAYVVRTAPRLTRARFDSSDHSWWRHADEDLRSDGAVWGGETGAHLLDGFLSPAVATVYADGLPRQTLLAHRLRKADGVGDVVVRERFWNWPTPAEGHPLAPPPLVYADLVATTDPRCLEAAERLRSGDAVLRRLDLS